MTVACVHKCESSKQTQIQIWYDLNEGHYLARTLPILFFLFLYKAAHQKSATVAGRGTAMESVPARPIFFCFVFGNYSHLRDTGMLSVAKLGLMGDILAHTTQQSVVVPIVSPVEVLQRYQYANVYTCVHTAVFTHVDVHIVVCTHCQRCAYAHSYRLGTCLSFVRIRQLLLLVSCLGLHRYFVILYSMTLLNFNMLF